MTPTEMKKIINDFSKSLKSKDKDEWWGTEKDIWDSIAKKFLMWYNSNSQYWKEKK